MKKRMIIPKDQIIQQMKNEMSKELKKHGINNFKIIDAEWTEEGIVIYYDEGT